MSISSLQMSIAAHAYFSGVHKAWACTGDIFVAVAPNNISCTAALCSKHGKLSLNMRARCFKVIMARGTTSSAGWIYNRPN